MANNCGTTSFGAGVTGVKSTNIGMTATWIRLDFRNSGTKPSIGYVYGSNQYSLPDDTTITSTKAIQVKDTSGTVILEGTWTSFSGTNVNFNVTTNTSGSNLSCLLSFGN